MPNSNITRRESREQAFIILFEKSFSDLTLDEIIENAEAVREFVPSEFALELINGVLNNVTQIDLIIEKFLKGWKLNRLSKVTLSLLRLAVYEMVFAGEIPLSVSINEAVELSKKYSIEKETVFLNGILGSVSKSEFISEEKQKL